MHTKRIQSSPKIFNIIGLAKYPKTAAKPKKENIRNT